MCHHRTPEYTRLSEDTEECEDLPEWAEKSEETEDEPEAFAPAGAD